MLDHHASTHALITGGAQGLGLAVAEDLIAHGCRNIVLADRNIDGAEAEAKRLSRDGVTVHSLKVEMGDIDSVEACVAEAHDLMGRIDALANCAANTNRTPVLETTPDQWDAIVTPNLKGAFFLLQAAARRAVEGKHPLSAVMILSITIHGGIPRLTPYIASKSGLAGVVRSEANNLRQYRIRVNGINAGWMPTPGEYEIQKRWHDRSDDWEAEAGSESPFGKLVMAEEVARQVCFFMGPASGSVTGTVMDFDQVVVGAYPTIA